MKGCQVIITYLRVRGGSIKKEEKQYVLCHVLCSQNGVVCANEMKVGFAVPLVGRVFSLRARLAVADEAPSIAHVHPHVIHVHVFPTVFFCANTNHLQEVLD